MLFVVLAVLFRRDDRHLVVELAVFIDGNAPLAVGECVTVEQGRLRLARQFTEPLAQNLLTVNGEILAPEEDDAALGDCCMGMIQLDQETGNRGVNALMRPVQESTYRE